MADDPDFVPGFSPDGQIPVAPAKDEPLPSEAAPQEDLPLEEPEEQAESEEGDEEEELETIEVEIGGKKYLVPKDVEPHLLREEDYTQKTQTLAEQRRQVEAYQLQLNEKAALHAEVLDDIAVVKSLDGQLKEYNNIDWPAYQLQDPRAAQYHWMQYQQLKGFREQAATTVNEKMQRASEVVSRSREETIQKTITALEKPDPDYLWPGYSEAHMSKLTDLSKKYFGLTDDEQARMTSPKSIKILNEAVMSRELRKAAQAPKPKPQEAQPVKQIPSNRGRRTPSSSGDELTTEQWVTRQRGIEARKRAALNGFSRN